MSARDAGVLAWPKECARTCWLAAGSGRHAPASRACLMCVCGRGVGKGRGSRQGQRRAARRPFCLLILSCHCPTHLLGLSVFKDPFFFSLAFCCPQALLGAQGTPSVHHIRSLLRPAHCVGPPLKPSGICLGTQLQVCLVSLSGGCCAGPFGLPLCAASLVVATP